LLCAGLVASAPQETTQRTSFEQSKQNADLSALATLQDTTLKVGKDSTANNLVMMRQKDDLTLTFDDGKTYLMKDNKLIHAGDTVLLGPKAKAALEKFARRQLEGLAMPALAPMPPMPAMAPMFSMAPMPPMPEMPPMASVPVIGVEIPPFPMYGVEVPAVGAMEVEGFPIQVLEVMSLQEDTTKMSKAEKEKGDSQLFWGLGLLLMSIGFLIFFINRWKVTQSQRNLIDVSYIPLNHSKILMWL
jgi:hypothetical protein